VQDGVISREKIIGKTVARWSRRLCGFRSKSANAAANRRHSASRPPAHNYITMYYIIYTTTDCCLSGFAIEFFLLLLNIRLATPT